MNECRPMSEYGVVLVYTTSAALQGEKALQRAGLVVKLIPVPREFSSDCGIALRFLWSEREAVEQALIAAHVEVAAVHRLASR
ncbi:MAG: DUF3343 domain-containing protein [Chloroflexi bacterium]|nr:DUF3343 domain-containing protein [Chloroflexota bacterium]